MDSTEIYQQVQDHYGSVARANNPAFSGSIAQAFGYSAEELASIPKDANLGLSCGNPLAIASLREGETVIDLGSGAGFDIFLASKKVGSHGRAIGVDMNQDMLVRAYANKTKAPNAQNISFIEGMINSVPLDASIADCIISNCVVNLVPEPEKPAVFAEMARLLKPGGRVAISDMLARKPLPAAMRESAAAYVGCVAGCSMKEDYARWLDGNGFQDIVIVDTESDLNVYTEMAGDEMGEKEPSASCCISPFKETASREPATNPCCSEEAKAAGCCAEEISDTTSCCQNSARDSASSTINCGCCSKTTSEAQTASTPTFDFAEIDINEFVGSFRIFAVKK